MIRPTTGGVLLDVHAQPGARRAAITGTHGDALKVRVGAPPAGGAANAAIELALAEAFGVARTAVAVVSGASSRRKTVKVTGVDEVTARKVIDMALATGLRDPER